MLGFVVFLLPLFAFDADQRPEQDGGTKIPSESEKVLLVHNQCPPPVCIAPIFWRCSAGIAITREPVLLILRSPAARHAETQAPASGPHQPPRLARRGGHRCAKQAVAQAIPGDDRNGQESLERHPPKPG